MGNNVIYSTKKDVTLISGRQEWRPYNNIFCRDTLLSVRKYGTFSNQIPNGRSRKQTIKTIQRETLGVNQQYLAKGGAELFIINQDAPLIAYELLESTLSADERYRMRQYVSDKLQRRYAARRGILRWLVGDALHIAPQDVRFAYGDYGKPSLIKPAIHFNLSHSQQYAMIGLCTTDIGIDIEYMRPSDDLEAITRTHFSLDEQSTWQALSAFERVQGFYNAWTRKEAFIKMDGRGLQIPLDSFSVSLQPREEAIILSSDVVDACDWQLWDVPAPDNYAAALVVGTQVQQVTLISYTI